MRISKDRISFSIIGLGGRSRAYLNALKELFAGKFEVSAIAEPDKEKRENAAKEFDIPSRNVFESDLALMEKPRLSDVAVIGTQDGLHYREATALIGKGYDLILEKPISSNINEITSLYECYKKHPGVTVAVCHVLRYSKFFNKLKEIIDSERLGKVVSIAHNENIGYYHYAHSYVRGPWNNSETSGPLIMTKSCHDMDILLYLLGNKRAKTISSVGSLSFFCEKNYNAETMAEKCINCPQKDVCAYSAVRIYGTKKIKSIVFDMSSVEKINESLGNNKYGRCVFKCDNNVCDHQSSSILFDDGVTATFSLSAFTAKVNRSIKIMCEYGEIRGIEKPYIIETTDFRTDKTTVIDLDIAEGGHGGADKDFIKTFMDKYVQSLPMESSLDKSIESHVMALFAEKSRLNGGQVQNVEEFMRNIG